MFYIKYVSMLQQLLLIQHFPLHYFLEEAIFRILSWYRDGYCHRLIYCRCRKNFYVILLLVMEGSFVYLKRLNIYLLPTTKLNVLYRSKYLDMVKYIGKRREVLHRYNFMNNHEKRIQVCFPSPQYVHI